MKNLLTFLATLMLVSIFSSCVKENTTLVDAIQDANVIAEKGTTSSIAAKDVLSPADLDINLIEIDMMAGQNTVAGSAIVGVYSDPKTQEHYLAVFVDMSAYDWVAGTTHIYAGDASMVPLNSGGNPQIGSFPYGSGNINIANVLADMDAGTYDPVSIFTMPLDLMVDPASNDYCFDIMIHAEVFQIDGDPGNPKDPLSIVGSQTAWANGTPVTPKMLKSGTVTTTLNKGSWAMSNEICLN